jgi:4-amino-4-deoxy-L-arabinose transferase-like glycosyltransferase
MPKTTHHRRGVGLLIAALAAGVLLPNLGGPPLWDDDEPRNAACSLAMWASGDWIVPTFNGRLRVEKPVLVNWLHLAGFATAGTNETGARLGSAVLTILTCLLTWRIAAMLFRADVAAWAGIVMATCLWTGITGRAATPDAPLAFFTTLALWAFIRGSIASGDHWRDGPVQLSAWTAATIGAACGLAMLTKGPVGLVLPLAGMGLFAWWQAAADPGRDGAWWRRLITTAIAAWRGVRPGLVIATALAVAAPWTIAVSARTGGDWPREFFLVHNVGRFASPMEGHSGSAIIYYPLVLLVGMFPWSMASALVGHHALWTVRTESRARAGMRLLVAWIAAWVIPFSLAGTKLPGYVWPVYPAIACCVGLFVADWIRSPGRATDVWMRWAWVCLAASGVALGIGLPLFMARVAPGSEWIGLIGLVPLVGSGTAWVCQSLTSRRAAVACWAATAAASVGLLVAIGPGALARGGGTRYLLARLPTEGIGHPIASYRAPPSTSFYGGLVADRGRVTPLEEPAEVVAFLAQHPGAPIVVDARFAASVAAALPSHYRVLRTATALPESRQLILFGTDTPTPTSRLAETAPGSSVPSKQR